MGTIWNVDTVGNLVTTGTVQGISPTTFTYVDPTSSIQTQLNSKQSTTTALTNLNTLGVSGANGVIRKTAMNTFSGGSTTTDLPEGTNLYYTDARVDSRINIAIGVSTLVTAMSGPFAVASYTITIVKTGTMLTLLLPPWTGTATASVPMVTTSALSAAFRPASEVRMIVSGVRNTQRSISIRVSTAGIITFFGDDLGGDFANTMTAAFNGQSITYQVP